MINSWQNIINFCHSFTLTKMKYYLFNLYDRYIELIKTFDFSTKLSNYVKITADNLMITWIIIEKWII